MQPTNHFPKEKLNFLFKETNKLFCVVGLILGKMDFQIT